MRFYRIVVGLLLLVLFNFQSYAFDINEYLANKVTKPEATVTAYNKNLLKVADYQLVAISSFIDNPSDLQKILTKVPHRTRFIIVCDQNFDISEHLKCTNSNIVGNSMYLSDVQLAQDIKIRIYNEYLYDTRITVVPEVYILSPVILTQLQRYLRSDPVLLANHDSRENPFPNRCPNCSDNFWVFVYTSIILVFLVFAAGLRSFYRRMLAGRNLWSLVYDFKMFLKSLHSLTLFTLFVLFSMYFPTLIIYLLIRSSKHGADYTQALVDRYANLNFIKEVLLEGDYSKIFIVFTNISFLSLLILLVAMLMLPDLIEVIERAHLPNLKESMQNLKTFLKSKFYVIRLLAVLVLLVISLIQALPKNRKILLPSKNLFPSAVITNIDLPINYTNKSNERFKDYFIMKPDYMVFADSYLIYHPKYATIRNLPISEFSADGNYLIVNGEKLDVYNAYLSVNSFRQAMHTNSLSAPFIVDDENISLGANLEVSLSLDCDTNTAPTKIYATIYTLNNDHPKELNRFMHELLDFPGCTGNGVTSFRFPLLLSPEIRLPMLVELSPEISGLVNEIKVFNNNRPLNITHLDFNSITPILRGSFGAAGEELKAYFINGTSPITIHTKFEDKFNLAFPLNQLLNNKIIDQAFTIWSDSTGVFLRPEK